MFLRFLIGDDTVASELESRNLVVKTQHSFTNSRLDLLILGDQIAIIIECKVNDPPRINKLEKYHREWTRNHGFAPLIYWLVRRRGGELGENRYLQREVTWDDLADNLTKNGRASLGKASVANIAAFCSYLTENGILLGSLQKTSRQPRGYGYRLDFADTLLERIAASVSDTDSEVIPPGDVKHHRLFIGRNCWRHKFQDNWLKRVVIYFKPTPCREAIFTLSGSILLWNRTYVPDPSFSIAQFPRWAAICHGAGKTIKRNSGGKWPGKYVYELTPPFQIERPVKYFLADCLEPEENLKVFYPSQVAEAVEEGRRIIERHFSLVDQF